MPKSEELFKLTMKHVVARTLGLSLLALYPLSVVIEFISQNCNGEFELGGFINDACEYLEDLINLTVKGAA